MTMDHQPEPVERTIDIEDMAAAFGYTVKQFKHELALWGWTMVMNEAERLAYAANWDRNKEVPERERKRWGGGISWENLRDATAQFVPPKTDNPRLANRRAGWLYVLFDAYGELCKIGCTGSSSGGRQKSIIGAHGNKLLPLLNARVEDRFGVEAQCHEHFKEHRQNGEWFQVRPDEVVAYVHEHVDWCEFDCETAARVVQAVVDAKLDRDRRHREIKSELEPK